MNLEDIKHIEGSCNLKIPDGQEVLEQSIVNVVNKLCDESNAELKEQEVLIISDNTDLTRRIVLKLANELKYLTIMEDDNEFIWGIEKEVLLNTGLSIYSTNSIESKLANYDIIINLKTNPVIDINKLKRKTVIMDLAIGRHLSNFTRDKRRDILVINDFIFKSPKELISDNELFKPKREISSQFYEILSESYSKGFIKVRIIEKNYTIKEAIKVYFKQKHSVSSFMEKKQK